MSSTYKRVHFIINPAAGKTEPILAIISRFFRGSGIRWDAGITQEFGDATRMTKEAVEDGVDLVAGYGGDGTQLEVANGLVGSGVPQAILPGGTGNAMAFALDIPRNTEQALRLIARSKNRRAIDLASLGDRTFMLRAYSGITEEQKASREMKEKLGNLAYVADLLKFAFHPPHADFEITVDGEVHQEEGMICYIFNAGASGGIALPELAAVELDDGLLDLYLITSHVRPLRAISHYVLDHGHFQAGINHWQGKEIRIEADPPQKIWIDGEPYGTTPITARVMPKALDVVVP